VRLIFIFLTAVFLFGFDIKQAKQILDSNNTKAILNHIKNNDYYFVAYAIKENRLDVLKLAIKNNFDFNTTDENGNTLLDFSAFFLNKKAVKLLLPIINPNHISKRGLNSVRMLLKGIDQEYRWILYPKEKLIKIFKDDKLSKEEIKNNLKLYTYLRKNALDILDILKQNGARFEIKGAYPNEITFLIAAREKRVDNEFKYRLFEKLLGSKGKLFFYIGMNEFDKAKKFINANPDVLKEPYFLDYPRHYFYVLQKDKKYCNIVKYMIEKNPNIVYYHVTSRHDSFIGGHKQECFKKLYSKFDIKDALNEYAVLDENSTQNDLNKIFEYIKNRDYKNLEKYVSKPGWNMVYYKNDVIFQSGYTPILRDYTTPFLEAVLGKYRDNNAVRIMLNHGGYMSGWNEIHYNILKNKPLHLEKYKKWERVYKLNEGDLLKNITPLYLAVLKNDLPLVKELIKNGADENKELNDNISIIEFSVYYDVKPEIIKYLIELKKSVNYNEFKLLAEYKRFDVLKYIKTNGIKINSMSLQKAVKQVLNDLMNIKSHLSSKDKIQIENKIIRPFKKLFPLKTDYNEMLKKAVDQNDTKKVLEALNHGADVNIRPVFFGKTANLLMVAALQNNKEMVKTLIKHNANVLFKNKRGNSFLHVACQNDILPIALKTEAKKYINDPVDLGFMKAYPITVALFNKRYGNVKLLLKNGAKLPVEYKKKIYCYLKTKHLNDLIEEFKKYGYSFNGIECK